MWEVKKSQGFKESNPWDIMVSILRIHVNAYLNQ